MASAPIKLPVLAVVREAYEYVWQERRLLWALALPAVIVCSLLQGAAGWIMWQLLDQPEHFATLDQRAQEWADSGFPHGLEIVAGGAAVVFIITAVFVMYTVAWHRAYLLPQEGISTSSAYRFHPRQARFFGSYLKAGLLMIPVMIVALPVIAIAAAPLFSQNEVDPSEGNTLWESVVYFAALWSVVVWFFSRFALAFPAVAVDRPTRIRDAWRLSRGNGWRLFWIMTLTAMPGAALAVLMESAGQLYWGSGLQGFLSANLLMSLVQNAVSFFTLAFGVTALSVSYQGVMGNAEPESRSRVP